MQFTIISLLAVATAVSALPQWTPPPTPPSNITGCNNNSGAVACCDTASAGLDVLGALCDISVLGILDPQCAGGAAFCCPTSQNGLINVGAICVPISGL